MASASISAAWPWHLRQRLPAATREAHKRLQRLGATLAHRLDQIGIARVAHEHIGALPIVGAAAEGVAETGLSRMVAGQAKDQGVLTPRLVVGIEILPWPKDAVHEEIAARVTGTDAQDHGGGGVQGHSLAPR